MEFVKDKEMYLLVQDTSFNRKYHNYKIGDICDCSKEHNAKNHAYKIAKRKVFKSPREKKIVFLEGLHEKIRKSINPDLPSRLSSIILYDNIDDCLELAAKWKKNAGLKPLGLFKVKCEGKLHACATTPDEEKSTELKKENHIAGIAKFWKGDSTAKTQEYLFQGKAQVIKIHNPF